MNLTKWVSVSLVSLLLTIPLAASARGQGPLARAGVMSSRGKDSDAARHPQWRNQNVHRLIGLSQPEGRAWVGGRRWSYFSYFPQSFGWPQAYDGYWPDSYYVPQYTYSPYFPYLYFYGLYAGEAERSHQAADEVEAALAREGNLTGPAEVGSFASDSLLLPPRDVALTLDDHLVATSPGGGPVVIGSGRHTLRIAAKASRAGQ